MPITWSPAPPPADPLTAELHAYNSAFLELELPWQWDAETFARLRSVASDADCVTVYVARNQPHLLRVYDPAFLRDLVQTTKTRLRDHAPV
ncbi:MAG: hypothetical protein JSR73_05745 [Proteobacteria bacterium]|nr:hypothetical protein [Pseudomonadota bacterium]